MIRLFVSLLCVLVAVHIDSFTMYGGVGGGGNAWMKIMGIGGDQVQKRQAQKGKKDVDKVGG